MDEGKEEDEEDGEEEDDEAEDGADIDLARGSRDPEPSGRYFGNDKNGLPVIVTQDSVFWECMNLWDVLRVDGSDGTEFEEHKGPVFNRVVQSKNALRLRYHPDKVVAEWQRMVREGGGTDAEKDAFIDANVQGVSAKAHMDWAIFEQAWRLVEDPVFLEEYRQNGRRYGSITKRDIEKYEAAVDAAFISAEIDEVFKYFYVRRGNMKQMVTSMALGKADWVPRYVAILREGASSGDQLLNYMISVRNVELERLHFQATGTRKGAPAVAPATMKRLMDKYLETVERTSFTNYNVSNMKIEDWNSDIDELRYNLRAPMPGEMLERVRGMTGDGELPGPYAMATTNAAESLRAKMWGDYVDRIGDRFIDPLSTARQENRFGRLGRTAPDPVTGLVPPKQWTDAQRVVDEHYKDAMKRRRQTKLPDEMKAAAANRDYERRWLGAAGQRRGAATGSAMQEEAKSAGTGAASAAVSAAAAAERSGLRGGARPRAAEVRVEQHQRPTRPDASARAAMRLAKRPKKEGGGGNSGV